MFRDLARMGQTLRQAARLMVGQPDYDTYVQHVRLTHPDKTPMSYEEFFRERQDTRFGAKSNGKCC